MKNEIVQPYFPILLSFWWAWSSLPHIYFIFEIIANDWNYFLLKLFDKPHYVLKFKVLFFLHIFIKLSWQHLHPQSYAIWCWFFPNLWLCFTFNAPKPVYRCLFILTDSIVFYKFDFLICSIFFKKWQTIWQSKAELTWDSNVLYFFDKIIIFSYIFKDKALWDIHSRVEWVSSLFDEQICL